MRNHTSMKPISPYPAFVGVWLLVLLLYSLDASNILIYETTTAIATTLSILAPFSIVYFILFFFRSLLKNCSSLTLKSPRTLEDNEKAIAQRVRLMTYLFVVILLAEVALEGYIPLISMMLGKTISQFDFGISSVHGFLLALGAINLTASYYIYLKYRNKKFLTYVFFYFAIFTLLVTRKMMVVAIIQMFFVYICLRGTPSTKRIYLIALLAIIGIIIFGLIGDIRTGRELFISLSRPNFEYPTWLPSGFMWVYIYITTPLLNLTNAIHSPTNFTYDLQFACSVLPGVIRGSFGCISLGFDNDYQISGAFNVATGYIALYSSWGLAGIMVFSALHGGGAFLFSSKRNTTIKSILSYSVFMQITILLIFSNGFFNLNVIAQLLILSFCFRRCSTLNPTTNQKSPLGFT